MQTALAGTALLMGLAGGPHCVAMCGAACAGVIRIARAPEGGGVATLSSGVRDGSASWVFHAGRVAGYAAAGAVAAAAVGSLAFASEQVAALRPLWVLLHVLVLAWALLLAALGRQPLWARHVGRSLAARFGFRFPVAIDREWRTLRAWWLSKTDYKFTSVSFLIDRRGVIRHIHSGGQYRSGDPEHAQLQAAIEKLLDEPAR